MQELQINYGNVKQRIYSEEEDRYILCRLAYYGIGSEDLYEKIKRDITEFPQFRFDWFFKSRTPQELHRRGQQLLALLAKEESKEEDDFGDEIPKGRKVGFPATLSVAHCADNLPETYVRPDEGGITGIHSCEWAWHTGGPCDKTYPKSLIFDLFASDSVHQI